MKRAQDRAAAVETVIPPPPANVHRMRAAFSRMVSRQWDAHVSPVLQIPLHTPRAISDAEFTKARFIGEMYARACYSMLLVSQSGPASIRIPVRAASILPASRSLTIILASGLLNSLGRLLPQDMNRQLLLSSALMGTLDVVLDSVASNGADAALRVASLLTRSHPSQLDPPEQLIAILAAAARAAETTWQSRYWEQVLEPAVCSYCLAEALAVQHAPDPTGMGHRWAGIEAAIKGMWYAVGPQIGLHGDLSIFEQGAWNKEQRWMADTSLLMQMIDDWMDQDEDRGTRLTPVTTGDWNLESAAQLFGRTVYNLDTLLESSGIRRPILKALITDLYKDYLHTALNAMRTGIAA